MLKPIFSSNFSFMNFIEQIYWARDVTFLFIDGNRLAMESWMAVFYGYDHQFVEADELIARGGPIIGAVVYDLIGSGGGLPIYDFLNIQYGMVCDNCVWCFIIKWNILK